MPGAEGESAKGHLSLGTAERVRSPDALSSRAPPPGGGTEANLRTHQASELSFVQTSVRNEPIIRCW